MMQKNNVLNYRLPVGCCQLQLPVKSGFDSKKQREISTAGETG